MRNVMPAVVACICAALLASCGNNKLGDMQADALAKLSKQLPSPYRDGLITESAHKQANDIVLVVRFADATVAMAKAKPEVFEALRLDENQAITELCQDPVLRPLHDAGGGVTRRFVDANDAVFFEATLKASDCIPH